MTHVLTRIAPADDIWIKGMMSILSFTGGGRLVRRRRRGRGMIDVEANRPAIFLRALNDVLSHRPAAGRR